MSTALPRPFSIYLDLLRFLALGWILLAPARPCAALRRRVQGDAAACRVHQALRHLAVEARSLCHLPLSWKDSRPAASINDCGRAAVATTRQSARPSALVRRANRESDRSVLPARPNGGSTGALRGRRTDLTSLLRIIRSLRQ